MRKLAVRILMLSMFTTSLLVVPLVAEVSAATTTTKHMKKKNVRVTHQRPKAADPYASPYSNYRYDDDPDRRAGGGGGGY
ncbi:hypothetical protein [Bradyrhizobium sp.]|uniref:hypothetical protein n=1 Tax=Bradyrhizobium sp. TaxID=376 RepID=UPI00262AED7C|nr:hypothetical protein [Bradyrhizobium sp.]